MAGLKVFKELELPSIDNIQLNSIYLIGNSNSSHVDIYITGNTPGIIKRVRNEEDINDLIDNKLSNFSLSDPIVFAGTLDLNIVNTGPTRLNSLFIVQNDYNEFKQNDLLLKISDTSPYFVKLNNSSDSGSSNSIKLIEWDPYNMDFIDYPFINNSSGSTFENGIISKTEIEKEHIILYPYDAGAPPNNNIEIIYEENQFTKIKIDINSDNMFMSTFCITELTSLNLVPLDIFPYNGIRKESVIGTYIISLNENEDVRNITPQNVFNRDVVISFFVNSMYQNEYDEYTSVDYAIVKTGKSLVETEFYVMEIMILRLLILKMMAFILAANQSRLFQI